MINILTSTPLARAAQRLSSMLSTRISTWKSHGDKAGGVFKILMAIFCLAMGGIFLSAIFIESESMASGAASGEESMLSSLPGVIPLVFQGVAFCLALAGFLTSLWMSSKSSMIARRRIIVFALALAALAALSAWLPSDVISTREAILGKAPAGETPSILAYLGKLLLIASLILSVPVTSFVYFRLGLMDRYVIRNFLTPFLMCLFSFMSIWILANLMDDGDTLSVLPFSEVLLFYLTQMPFVILFSLPIAVLLSGLYAMSQMSRSNEFISMIGAGRSVLRILTPLFLLGLYISLIGLAFKYEWAPKSVGYRKAVLETAARESSAKAPAMPVRKSAPLWAKRGWMYVNAADRRCWFVGGIPLKLSDPMADVVITELNDEDQPVTMWIAKQAKWIWNASPPKWILSDVRIYRYGANHVPTLSSEKRLEITDWSDTPWKVLSSSQNPEHLGLPELQTYLLAHRNLDEKALAPFRTSRWNIIAEPLGCLALLLVAAPLGIVYSRRGVMSGVSGAIAVFAFMYVMRATMSALGNIDRVPPFLAAWSTNFIVVGIGIALLWFRAQNRDVPSLKAVFSRMIHKAN